MPGWSGVWQGGASRGRAGPGVAVRSRAGRGRAGRGSKKAPRSKRPRGLLATVVVMARASARTRHRDDDAAPPGTRLPRKAPVGGRSRPDRRVPCEPLRRHPQPGGSPRRDGPSFSVRSCSPDARPPRRGRPTSGFSCGGPVDLRGRRRVLVPCSGTPQGVTGTVFSSTAACTCCPQADLRGSASSTDLWTRSVDDGVLRTGAPPPRHGPGRLGSIADRGPSE